MAKPLVAVVGRPNVGKSTFFNKVVGQRISIVEDTPGVTRDRIYADVEWTGRTFTLIDTGGIDPRSDDVLLSQMRDQAQIAMDTADVICFFVDGRDGLTDDDREVATMLRKHDTYLKIAEKTGASTATISRVNRSLNYGEDGYTVVFSRMESMKDFIENEDVSGYKKNKK